MTPLLYAHPFASYCQKTLIALYENATPFTFKTVAAPEDFEELGKLWPFRQFPVLVDGDMTLIEATIVIEYLDTFHRGATRFVPDDAKAALDVRFMDRFFDNYVHTPMQAVVYDALRAERERDAKTVADARDKLEAAYRWLDERMAGREWASGETFTLADCAAGPALFYADWVHRIDAAYANVVAYRERLNARPSFKRAIDEARPFRQYFPLGAPDRD
ncbi:MAG TPA: glutathione S-transferase family protein [Tahibacter sp.]|nr:glutathione S-transferase family protein [Tahibacter sp.]